MPQINDYIKEKAKFLITHGNEYNLDITDKEFGDTQVSIRRFNCKDGKTWNEILSNEVVPATVSFDKDTSIQHPIRCTVTEYWSSDIPEHRKVYEVTK